MESFFSKIGFCQSSFIIVVFVFPFPTCFKIISFLFSNLFRTFQTPTLLNLISFANEVIIQFDENCFNKTFNVLFEAEKHNDFLNGFTENYIKVKIPYHKNIENTIQNVKLTKIDAEGVVEIEKIETPNFKPRTSNLKPSNLKPKTKH